MTILAVTRLELRRLFVRPLAWVLAGLTLAWLAWKYTVLLGSFLLEQVRLAALSDGPGFTDLVAVPLLAQLLEIAFLIVPLLTMYALAGERRNGTLALLFGTGTSAWHIVLGKYLAALVWLLLWLALIALMPLIMAHHIALDWGKFAAALLGLLFTFATLAALGIACSAFVSHPAIAATIALVLTLALWTVNLGAEMAGINGGFINWLAMSTHVQSMLRGLVSTADIAWFVLLTALCLALATRRVTADKGRG